MKTILEKALTFLMILLLSSCNNISDTSNSKQDIVLDDSESSSDVTEEADIGMENIIYITANGTKMTVKLADSSAAKELAELLNNGDITINASDYGSFEKVGDLPQSLTRTDEQITTETGDIMLYQGNKLVIFYGENSWSYTRLGKIENITSEQLKNTLGNDDVELVLSSAPSDNKADVSHFDLSKGINGHASVVMLNSGYEMPIAGIGTYSLKEDTCVNALKYALEQGVRLIDTAYMYGNEKEVGQAVREFMAETGTPREEIFVITKIYPGEQFKNPERAIQDSLDKLDIGYIDMMLLHHPDDNDVKAYKAMEKFVEQGKIRSLGLSNWYIEEIDDFISQVNIKPALVQNEIHPYYQEQKVIPYMHDLGIVMQAWYPLGGRGHQSELLNDETILKIAKAHGKSAAQVILRWDLQNGVVVIPGSSNPAHILENISLFDFELTDEEMAEIAALDRNEKHDWY